MKPWRWRKSFRNHSKTIKSLHPYIQLVTKGFTEELQKKHLKVYEIIRALKNLVIWSMIQRPFPANILVSRWLLCLESGKKDWESECCRSKLLTKICCVKMLLLFYMHFCKWCGGVVRLPLCYTQAGNKFAAIKGMGSWSDWNWMTSLLVSPHNLL